MLAVKISNIKNLVAVGRLRDAIDGLLQFSAEFNDSDFEKSVILLSYREKELQQQLVRGLLLPSEIEASKEGLALATLTVLNRYVTPFRPNPSDFDQELPEAIDDFLPLLNFRTKLSSKWYGNETQKGEIVKWITESKPYPDACLIFEEGGTGKSRLALELCKEFYAENWWAGFVDPGNTPNVFDTEATGFLFVIDNAEERIADLNVFVKMIFDSTFYRNGKPIKLLLLSRQDNVWWEKKILIEASDGGKLKVFPIKLERIDYEAIIHLFKEVCAYLCMHYGITPISFTDEELKTFFFRDQQTRSIYSKPLFVLISAIHTVKNGSFTKDESYREVIQKLVQWEKERLMQVAQKLDINGTAMARLVALTPVLGQIRTPVIMELLKKERWFGFEDKSDFFDCIRRFHMWKDGGVQPLQPDIFAAALLVDAIQENEDLIPEWFWALIGPTPDDNLKSRLLRLMYDAVVICGDTSNSILKTLCRMLDHNPQRAVALEPLTCECRASAYIRPFLIQISRQLSGDKAADPVRQAERMMHLAGHIFWENKSGKEALQVAEDAIARWRTLINAGNEEVLPKLAHSLHILSLACGNDIEKGLQAAQESVAISHKVFKTKRDEASADQLGQSLKEITNQLRSLRKPERALKAANIAAKIFADLIERHPDNYYYVNDYARILHNRSLAKKDLNMLSEALEDIQEAVERRKELSKKNPWGFEPEYALSLKELADTYGRLKQTEKQAECLEACIRVRTRLSVANPSLNFLELLDVKIDYYQLVGKQMDPETINRSISHDLEVLDNLIDRDALPNTLNAANWFVQLTYDTTQSKYTNKSHAVEIGEFAVRFLEKFKNRHPDEWNDAFNINLMGILLNLGNGYGSLQQREKSIDVYSISIEIAEALRPDSVGYQKYISTALTVIYANRGMEKMKLGQLEAGRADIRHSFDLEVQLRGRFPETWLNQQHFQLLVSYKNATGDLLKHRFTEDAFLLVEYRQLLLSKLYKPDAPIVIEALFDFANIMFKNQQMEQGVEITSQALTKLEECFTHPEYFDSDYARADFQNTIACKILNYFKEHNLFGDSLDGVLAWVDDALATFRSIGEQKLLAYTLDTYADLVYCSAKYSGKKDVSQLQKALAALEESLNLLKSLGKEELLDEVADKIPAVRELLG